ncbi:unnamed protein product [Callosobruchus maculatus]|uniref:Uncharacterized protein n=1 Tax=Callosobruchus maculatus TaxID=64391 RepID=A0A653BKG2_CALMS|nr:unnamed protein product [Callosobruchus maculatus]
MYLWGDKHLCNWRVIYMVVPRAGTVKTTSASSATWRNRKMARSLCAPNRRCTAACAGCRPSLAFR